jgi:hypothetical protein
VSALRRRRPCATTSRVGLEAPPDEVFNVIARQRAEAIPERPVCVRHEIATPAGLAMTYECAMSRAIARGYVPLTAPT